MRTWIMALGVLLGLWAAGCSVPDEGDMAELENNINNLEPSVFTDGQKWTVQRKIINLLASKKGDVGYVACRWDGGKEGEYVLYRDAYRYSASDMWLCMLSGTSYTACFDEWVSKATADVKRTGHPWVSDCKGFYNLGYTPDDIAAEATDQNEFNEGYYETAWKIMTARDIAEAFIGSPTPPPLPGGFGALRFMLPALCALGNNWGCPDHPAYPRDPSESDKAGQ